MKVKIRIAKSFRLLSTTVTRPVLALAILSLTSCAAMENMGTKEQELNEEQLIALGDRANENGDWQTAVTFYQQAHLADTESTAPLLAMASTFERNGAYENAAKLYYRIANQTAGTDDKVALLVKSGQSWLRARQLEQAATVFDEGRGFAPDAPALSIGLGISQDMSGDFAKAQATYQQVLNRTPGNTAAINNLGLSYLFTGDTDLAIRHLERLGSKNDSQAQHRFNLAMAYGMADRMDQAERILRELGMESDVGENLAAFERLRSMSPMQRAEFIYGSQLLGGPRLPPQQ